MTTIEALRAGTLAGCRELRLNDCALTQVPPEVFDLADTLEVLDLSGNALTDLPADFDRLTNLRALFCSRNPFARLPPVLGACPALTQIGFRGCGLDDLPAEALPPDLRWLTLTDNRLRTLPDALGARPSLRKLMLAGNRLDRLPDGLADASGLELLRVSANRLETLPAWLGRIPRLAWLAWAGNPAERRPAAAPVVAVAWDHLRVGAVLGEGASGYVHRALWHAPGRAAAIPAALKLFKGAMTSDGLPDCEMAACLAAGEHANLVGASGLLIDHPKGIAGLIMPLVPEAWRILAQPPSLASCSRDVYSPGLALPRDVAIRIAGGIGAATAHLHGRRLLHGDLYAHNVLWDGGDGAAVLSDFGAASFLPDASDTLERLDVRAWGILLGELLDRCGEPQGRLTQARRLQSACVQPDVAARPSMADALDALNGIV